MLFYGTPFLIVLNLPYVNFLRFDGRGYGLVFDRSNKLSLISRFKSLLHLFIRHVYLLRVVVTAPELIFVETWSNNFSIFMRDLSNGFKNELFFLFVSELGLGNAIISSELLFYIFSLDRPSD